MKLSKVLLAASLCVLSMVVTKVQAQTGVTWNPGPNAGNWNVIGNWGGTAVPGPGYKAFFNVVGAGPCIVSDTEGGCQVTDGDGGPGEIIVTNGGTLTCGDTSLGNNDLYAWTGIGTGGSGGLTNGLGTLIVDGGTVNFNYHVWLGLSVGGVGTIIINSGTAAIVNGNGALGLGNSGTPGSTITINGGSFTINNNLQMSLPNTNQINLAGGELIIIGNGAGTVQPFIAANKIVGYGGTGTVMVDTNSDPGYTIVTGVPGTGPTTGPSAFTKVTYSAGGLVTVTYNSSIGATYHIVSSPTLSTASTSWSTTVAGSTTNATATSTSFSFTDPNTTDYYRVVSP